MCQQSPFFEENTQITINDANTRHRIEKKRHKQALNIEHLLLRITARTIWITRVRWVITLNIARRRCLSRIQWLVKQSHTLLKLPNLFSFHILIHALPFESAGTCTLARTIPLRRLCARRTDHKVVEFYQNWCWKCVNFQLNFFRAL